MEISAVRFDPRDRSALSLIGVHRRPDMLFFRPNAKIKTKYWPPMNADERR